MFKCVGFVLLILSIFLFLFFSKISHLNEIIFIGYLKTSGGMFSSEPPLHPPLLI